MRIVSAGHAVFAATMIALGILGFANARFALLWQPIPIGVPAPRVLGYLCPAISVVAGTGLLRCSTASLASRLLFTYVLVWLLLFRMPNVFVAPAAQDTWSAWGETAVVVAGAWVLYTWFAVDWDRQWLPFATGVQGLRNARVLFGVALLPFGLAHFRYLRETASLVPAWLPWRAGWACFTGGAFMAASVGVVLGLYARLAASLSALQLGLFTLLVWVPIVAAGPSAYQFSEFVISAGVTAGAWVVADSYRGVAWLSARGRRTSG
jgi:uncharacterized membrane protein